MERFRECLMSETIAGDLYFRCETYSQTISVAACRHYRGLAQRRTVRIGYYIRTMGRRLHPRCMNCPRAERLEAGQVLTWPLEQLLAARAQGAPESLPPESLPPDTRIEA